MYVRQEKPRSLALRSRGEGETLDGNKSAGACLETRLPRGALATAAMRPLQTLLLVVAGPGEAMEARGARPAARAGTRRAAARRGPSGLRSPPLPEGPAAGAGLRPRQPATAGATERR